MLVNSKKDIVEVIKKVIREKKDQSISMIPFNTIKEAFEELNFEFEFDNSGDSINGWQIDFFYYFKHKKYGRYCASGSLWYGDFLIGKADEEDD